MISGVCKFAFIVFLYSFSPNEKLRVKRLDISQHREISSNDNIVLIRFAKNDISVHWDNSKSAIVEDVLYKNLKRNFRSKQNYLVEQITNVSMTKAIICSKGEKLLIGDVAFLIIIEMTHVPYFEITHVQCDSFEPGCPFPTGYFEGLQGNRSKIRKRVKHYLSIHEPASIGVGRP